MVPEEASRARRRLTTRFMTTFTNCCASQEPPGICHHAMSTVALMSGNSIKEQRALFTTATADNHEWGLSAIKATLPSRKAVSPTLRKGSLTSTLSGEGVLSPGGHPKQAVRAAEEAGAVGSPAAGAEMIGPVSSPSAGATEASP